MIGIDHVAARLGHLVSAAVDADVDVIVQDKTVTLLEHIGFGNGNRRDDFARLLADPTAFFVAAYTPWPGTIFSPDVDTVVTKWPRP